MVLFSFHVEVFVENACVCMANRAYVCSCSVHLIVCYVHCYMLLGWSSRLSMWIKLILSLKDTCLKLKILIYIFISGQQINAPILGFRTKSEVDSIL